MWEQVHRAVGVARSNRPIGRAGRARPAVGVSFVVTTWNHRGLEPAVRAARDAGVDYAHIRPAFEGPHTQLDRQLDRGEIADSLAAVAALESLSDARFRVLGVTRRFAEIEAPPRDLIHCRATPLVAYVLPTGDVSICTVVRDAAFNPAVPDPFLGNVHRDAFFDLWGTDKHRRIIAGLSTSGCTRCHFAEYNRALALIEDDALHHDFL